VALRHGGAFKEQSGAPFEGGRYAEALGTHLHAVGVYVRAMLDLALDGPSECDV
jgi:hypothetical protein